MDNSTAAAIKALVDIASGLDAIARAMLGSSDYIVNGEDGNGGIDNLAIQLRDSINAHADAITNAGSDIRTGLEVLANAIIECKDATIEGGQS